MQLKESSPVDFYPKVQIQLFTAVKPTPSWRGKQPFLTCDSDGAVSTRNLSYDIFPATTKSLFFRIVL